ncbi:MAG: serine/threonine protein kinase [Acidobacteria bacterium]|nr:serine/threonine protein kinase [Acidobacteriota bacterium]
MSSLSDRALDKIGRSLATSEIEGANVDDRYVLVRLVGEGGMGAVWEAEDSALGRRVALKIVDPIVAGPALTGRLVREAKLLAGLEHPGLVPVHDTGTLADGRVYCAMKLVRGERLDAHLANIRSRPDRLRLFLRVCEPVAFAHAHGVVHRDLKPSNVMVGPFGEVLVMDWGVAKVLAGAGDEEVRTAVSAPAPSGLIAGTAAGTVVGTRGWMAPEQERGEAGVDVRADIWALGRLLAFILADGDQIPKPLSSIVARACAESRGARYPSVEALAADVARYLDGEAVSAHPESILERAVRFARRHEVAILLLLAYLLARAAVYLIMRR